MRKRAYGLAILISAFFGYSTAAAAEGVVHFKGQLTGLRDSLIVLVPTNGGTTRDTVLTPGGKFDFTLRVEEPCTVRCLTPGTLRHRERISFDVIAVPGERAELSGSVKKGYYFSGSRLYEDYNEVELALEAIGKPLKEMAADFEARMVAGGAQPALVKEYKEKKALCKAKQAEYILNYIRQNPASEVSAAMIPKLQEIDKMNHAVSLLSPEVREGRMKAYYQPVIDEMVYKAEAKKQTAKRQAVGVFAPDFTLKDIHGKPFTLSSLHGRYVIIDFWGSWCSWCIKGFPEMKRYYEKYNGKFEILGVDCRDTEEKWKEAVKKYELPWLHVYNPKSSTVLSDYAIQGFPTKIIIGPDGRIVKTFAGENSSFYTFLDETFGK